jgi:hypothetical protein
MHLPDAHRNRPPFCYSAARFEFPVRPQRGDWYCLLCPPVSAGNHGSPRHRSGWQLSILVQNCVVHLPCRASIRPSSRSSGAPPRLSALSSRRTIDMTLPLFASNQIPLKGDVRAASISHRKENFTKPALWAYGSRRRAVSRRGERCRFRLSITGRLAGDDLGNACTSVE